MSAVNPVDAQKVQDDGQKHHQGASKEEIVVVDKGKAEPAAVGLPDASLPKVPGGNGRRTVSFRADAGCWLTSPPYFILLISPFKHPKKPLCPANAADGHPG